MLDEVDMFVEMDMNLAVCKQNLVESVENRQDYTHSSKKEHHGQIETTLGIVLKNDLHHNLVYD